MLRATQRTRLERNSSFLCFERRQGLRENPKLPAIPRVNANERAVKARVMSFPWWETRMKHLSLQEK